MWFHSKGPNFLHIIVFSCPLLCKYILVGRLNSCFLTHTKKHETHVCLIFQEQVKIYTCVLNFILDNVILKSQCTVVNESKRHAEYIGHMHTKLKLSF